MAKKITDETLKFNIVVNGNKAQKEYNDLKKAQDKLIEKTKELEKQALELKKANKENGDEYKKLTKQIEDNQKEIADTGNKMSKLTKEIGLNNLSMAQLGKEARKLKRIMDNLDPETEEWKDYNKTLAAVTNRQFELRKEMRETAIELGKQQAAVTTVTSGFANLFSGLKKGNFKDVKEGISDVKSGLKTLIATPIGIFIATLSGIVAVTKLWFNYNKEIAKSVKLTEQLTGFDGQELQDYRASVQATANTFDKEFNEVLRASNSLSKQMKISQQEALALINQGFTRGADVAGDFLDKVEEYPVQFKNAGFSAQDFIDVAVQEPKGGIFGDKLLDAIKETDLSLKEMTNTQQEALENAFGKKFADEIAKGLRSGEVTTKDAIGRIIDESDKIGLNMQQQQQLVADVFKGAGEDAGGFQEIILQINEAFKEENKILNQNEKATQRLVKSNEEYEQALADLFDASKSGFPSMLNNLKSISNEIFTNILRGFSLMFTSIEQLEQQSASEGQKKAVERISENINLFNTKAAEEAKIQIDAATKNLERLKKEAENIGLVSKFFGGDDAYAQQIAEAEAYLKELKLIAEGESTAFKEFQEKLKDQKVINDDSGDNRTKEEKDKALEEERKYQELKLQLVRDYYDRQAKDDFERRANKIKQDSNAREQEINNLQISEDKKRELLKLSFQQETDEINALNKEREETELLRIQEFEDRKRNLENNIALSKAQSDEQKEILKAQQDAEKAIIDLERLKLDKEEETALILLLEEQEKAALENINKKYREKDAKARAEANKKELEERKKLHQEIIDGSINLVGQESRLGQALLAVKATMAAKETLIQLGVIKAKAATAVAEGTLATKVGAANTAKVGFPKNVPLLIAFAAQAAGIIGAIKNAVGAAKNINTSVPGFEEGLYPVTRAQDGKKFNASFGGKPITQIVPTPKTFLAGEMPEMIIDPKTFKKMDPMITDYILQLAGKRPMPAFESGKYPKEMKTSSSDVLIQTNEMTPGQPLFSDDIGLEIIERLKSLKINFTLTDVIRLRELQQKLEATENAAKN
ncbi:phage tail tape measure protein [Winogradskyella sp.]|uniref:phage tail tape measure protein n=1 Tax=Winogradskyella sp. TaxID=1883156 RepID=UPI003BAA2E68